MAPRFAKVAAVLQAPAGGATVSSKAKGPTKGERTRRHIVERAAVLFNMRGVTGASMADISLATGLEKGGVYNHFETKDALALAAFDYAAGLVRERLETAINGAASSVDGLRAVVDVYRQIAEKPLIAGGCPILNTAIEADDTHAALRDRARKAFDHWQQLLVTAVRKGVASGELEPIDPAAFASIVVATLEGGVMLARLYRDPTHMRFAADHLTRHIDLVVRRSARRRA
jgi:TetR/AcrR family transcriptional repressor of nem operon